MRQRRPRPCWFHLIRNAVPVIWVLAFVGLVWALVRLGWFLLGGEL